MHLNERMTKKGMDIKQTAIRKEASAGKHPMGLAEAFCISLNWITTLRMIFIQWVMKGLKRHFLRQQE
jgi:hypothetical protein